MTRNSIFILLGFCIFALLHFCKLEMMGITQSPSPDYQTLQISFANVFQDINFVTNEKKIASHEITVDLEFLLEVITSLFYLGWV